MAVLKSKARLERELEDRVFACNHWLIKLFGLHSCNDLMQLLSLHREIWKAGLRHPNIDSDAYGMFRCTDMSKLSADQVFLGNIYGRWTNSLSFWESEKASDPESYHMMFNQYWRVLVSSLKDLRNQVYDNGYARDRICENIMRSLMETTGARVNSVEILNPKISDSSILSVRFRTGDGSSEWRYGSLLNIDGSFFIPEKFEMGVVIDKKNILSHRYINISYPGKVVVLPGEPKLDNSDTKSLSRSELKTLSKGLEEKKAKGYHFGPSM